MRSKEEIQDKIEELEGALGIFYGEVNECEDAYIEGAIWALKWVLEEVREIGCEIE